MLLAHSSATAQTVIQSFPSPSRPQSSRAAANELNKRRELALDAAVIAARGKLFDLSIEAVKRATEQPVVMAKPDFQSSLLGGGQPTGSTIIWSSSQVPSERSEQTAVRQKLELLVDVWKEMEAPPEKIAALLQDIVLPGGKGQMIQMFAGGSGSPMYQSYSFDMAAKPAPPARVLGFELVDWARAAGKLDALVPELEKRTADPISQTAANALLLYAHRVAGRSEAVTKTLDNLLAKTSRSGEGSLVIVALTRPVPEDVQDDALDERAVGDFALRLLQGDANNGEIRAYATQRLAMAIEQGDRAQVKRITEAIEASIDALNVNGDQFKAQLKSSFWSSAERECIRKEQPDLVIDFVLRQNTGDQSMNRYGGMDQDRLTVLAAGSSELRMERARRLLLETPLASPNQLNIATLASGHTPPEFFPSRDSVEEVLPHVVPFEGAKTVSLLDMLLNEAEARGESQAIVEQLFKNASDRDDVIKLIAQWLMLRAEKRGTKVDEKIAALGHLESEQDFIDWVKRMPNAAASELLSEHIAEGPLSGELAELFEHRQAGALNTTLWSVEGFAEKFYQRQNPSAPPLRSLSQLKHWCLASSLPSRESPNYRTILEVSTGSGKQALGYQGGTLKLRYPVTGEVTVQGTFKSSNLDMFTLGLHGIAVRLSNNASILFGHHGGSAGASIPLDASNKIAWSLNKDTLSLTVNGEVKRKWRQSAAGTPFVSFVAPFLIGTVPDDFAMIGNVEIPRQVELIDPGLTGWNSQVFYHVLPSSDLALEEITVGNSQNGNFVNVSSNARNLMWRVDKGEIAVGRSSADDSADESPSFPRSVVDSYSGMVTVITAGGEAPKTRQTEIHYDRPLLEGERIEFELFHDSGAQTAAPVTGRLAYCLEGEKVALHWIATEAELKRFNLPEENRADDPAGEQLAPVKLEDNAWNRLALRIESGKVVLSIADQDVYRRPLATNESTHFGFFADPTAPETRIRNVILKGDWPSELPKDLWELRE